MSVPECAQQVRRPIAPYSMPHTARTSQCPYAGSRYLRDRPGRCRLPQPCPAREAEGGPALRARGVAGTGPGVGAYVRVSTTKTQRSTVKTIASAGEARTGLYWRWGRRYAEEIAKLDSKIPKLGKLDSKVDSQVASKVPGPAGGSRRRVGARQSGWTRSRYPPTRSSIPPVSTSLPTCYAYHVVLCVLHQYHAAVLALADQYDIGLLPGPRIWGPGSSIHSVSTGRFVALV
eukprot:931828-Rhodomonas_salina.4